MIGKRIKGICSKCKNEGWIKIKSKMICTFCDARDKQKLYAERRRQKIKTGKVADKDKMQAFYKKFWKNQPTHICFETGEQLWTYHSWHVHHVLHKEDYPQLAENEDICVLLSLEQHALWHSLAPSDREKKMPLTYQRYLELKEKYNI